MYPGLVARHCLAFLVLPGFHGRGTYTIVVAGQEKNSLELREDVRHLEKTSRRWTAVNSASSFFAHDLCPVLSCRADSPLLPPPSPTSWHRVKVLASGRLGTSIGADPALITLWRAHWFFLPGAQGLTMAARRPLPSFSGALRCGLGLIPHMSPGQVGLASGERELYRVREGTGRVIYKEG